MSESEKFSPTTVTAIGKAAMYICSNPDCLRFTGYETNEGKPRALAEAAHMLPASKKGPRADELSVKMSTSRRQPTVFGCA